MNLVPIILIQPLGCVRQVELREGNSYSVKVGRNLLYQGISLNYQVCHNLPFPVLHHSLWKILAAIYMRVQSQTSVVISGHA